MHCIILRDYLKMIIYLEESLKVLNCRKVILVFFLISVSPKGTLHNASHIEGPQ